MSKVFFLSMLLIAAVNPLYAQAAPDPFDAILSNALLKAPGALQAGRQWEAAGLSRTENWLSLLPSISLDAGGRASGNGSSYTNTWSAGVSLSRSFSDIDGTVSAQAQADLRLDAALNSALASRLDFAGNLIAGWSGLIRARAGKVSKLDELSQLRELAAAVAIRVLGGREITANLDKLSNEIELRETEMGYDDAEFGRAAAAFERLAGFTIDRAAIPPDVPLLLKNDRRNSLTSRLLEATNQFITARLLMLQAERAERQAFIPTAGVSAYVSYDPVAGNAGWSASASLSFSPLEYFSRESSARRARMDEATAGENAKMAMQAAIDERQSLSDEADLYEKKSEILERGYRIQENLLKLYRSDYESGRLDLSELRRHQGELLAARETLITAKLRVWEIRKRLESGYFLQTTR